MATGIAAALLAGVAHGAEPFAFRGASLGMGLEAWRASPLPAQLFHSARAACSSDQDAPRALSLDLAASEIKGGLVVCSYMDLATGGWVGQRIEESEFTSAAYYFLNGALIEIELVAVVDAHPAVVDGITGKYGPPRSVQRDIFQTQSGSTFPRVQMRWVAPDEEIVLTTPDLRSDRMTVIYGSVAGMARRRALRMSEHPGAEAM
jgi:hypothetical protein